MNPHRTVANLRFHGGYYIYRYTISNHTDYIFEHSRLKITSMDTGYRLHYVYNEIHYTTSVCSDLISIVGARNR